MGAERFIQVFDEASKDLINPENPFALTPLKQMKMLQTMLYQVNQGGANIHITKMLDAISDAIHIKSASGQLLALSSRSRKIVKRRKTHTAL